MIFVFWGTILRLHKICVNANLRFSVIAIGQCVHSLRGHLLNYCVLKNKLTSVWHQSVRMLQLLFIINASNTADSSCRRLCNTLSSMWVFHDHVLVNYSDPAGSGSFISHSDWTLLSISILPVCCAGICTEEENAGPMGVS